MSRRRRIVESSIATWNATFGKEQTLHYPPRLEEALRRLQGTVELSLPGLIVRDGFEVSLKQSWIFQLSLTVIAYYTLVLRL